MILHGVPLESKIEVFFRLHLLFAFPALFFRIFEYSLRISVFRRYCHFGELTPAISYEEGQP